MKYDPTGTVMWTSQEGTTSYDWAYSVAVSADGFIYVTGWTYGSLNGQPNAGRRHYYYRVKSANIFITQVVTISF